MSWALHIRTGNDPNRDVFIHGLVNQPAAYNQPATYDATYNDPIYSGTPYYSPLNTYDQLSPAAQGHQ